MIDLHVHSNASDGTLSPTEVLNAASEAGLKAIALTDHDTIDGIPEIMSHASLNTGLKVIPGIELSCYYNKREIHILGLFVDYKNPGLINELNSLKNLRLKRNLKMIELMNNDGIDVSLEKLLFGNSDSVITRAHFARYLIEAGICKNKEQAFKKYIGIGCKYYLPKEEVTYEQAMDILNRYSEISVLAHPLLYKLGYAELDILLDKLKNSGLTGLECYHSSNNYFESEKLRKIAERHNLLVSGGSDFHGKNKPDINIGTGRGHLHIPDSLLLEMENYISKKRKQA